LEETIALPRETVLDNQIERKRLYQKYCQKLEINTELTRQLVSFQANKSASFYRWLKYKEAFSSELVRYCINRFHPDHGSVRTILDPFAGAGTTLTTSTKAGWKATGIELLPVGVAAMYARLRADTVKIHSFQYFLNRLSRYNFSSPKVRFRFPHLRITEGAFPRETENAISSYVDFVRKIRNEDVKYLFLFACMSILEDVSYTRKDGQYLRWDSRSPRNLRSSFAKGEIADFRRSILSKLQLMLEDIKHRNGDSYSSTVSVFEDSCLNVLPTLPDCSFDIVLTSPPYCNRYDYTRTYALELAFLGYDELTLKSLRQTLLSATVENKSKRHTLYEQYLTRNQENRFIEAIAAFTNQPALQEVLAILYRLKEQNELNNLNIPSMVENYFFEMNLVIHELARVLSKGGRIIMVNDNVQYHGEEIPVDLILCDFAEHAGLSVDAIWVLQRGKGNSSQQMGAHGRNELRKCVYVWSKSPAHQS